MDGDELPSKDTLVVKMSDMHSGGTTALFPDSIRYFKHGNHTPNDKQLKIFEHFEKCGKIIGQLRKKKRLIVVHNGDAIDGVHHNSAQVVTTQKNAQIDLHVELMKHFFKLAKFKNGDKIYYTTGTESHTQDNEDIIGKKMGAVMNGDLYAHDELELEVNGKRIWFAHKGPGSGKGANEGNPLYNFIRDVWIDCKASDITPPDVAVFAHVHTPRYRIFTRVINGNIVRMDGWILPSWQMKTRFAHGVAAMQKNSIGLAYFEVTKNGDIVKPDFETM